MKIAAALLIGLIALVATVCKFVNNELGRVDAEEAWSVVSESLSEAKRDGVLIAALTAQPAEIDFDGTKIVILEAWMERYAVHRYPLVWLHRREAAGGYVVALRPALFVSPKFTLWPERNGSSSFATRVWRGGMLYSYYSEEEPMFPMTLLSSRGRERIPVLVLRKSDSAPAR